MKKYHFGSYLTVSVLYIVIYVLINLITVNYFEVLSPDPRFPAPWYPPVGITITLLMGFGLAYIPPVLVVQYIIALFFFGYPLPLDVLLPATIIPVGYSLMVIIAIKLLKVNLIEPDIIDIFKFILLTFFSTLIIGILLNLSYLMIEYIDQDEFISSLINFVIGDSIGILIFTPLLLYYFVPWVKSKFSNFQQVNYSRSRYTPLSYKFVSSIILNLIFVILIVLIASDDIQLFYLAYIPLIIISVVYGYRGAIISNFITNVGLIVIISISSYYVSNFLNLQILLSVLTYTGLILGIYVSEQNKTQKQLVNNQERLLKAQKEYTLGRLTSGIAHDFTNILTAITGYMDLTKNYFETDIEKSRKYLFHVENAINRARLLIDDLRKFDTQRGNESINSDVHMVLKQLHPILKMVVGTNISLIIDKNAKEARVKTSESNIQQLLLNPIVNARDAMVDGGTIVISTKNISSVENPYIVTSENTQFLKLCITDNGNGIPQKLKNKVHQRYFTTKQTGTGLGLSIVDRILTQLNGFFTIEDNEPIGTKIKMYLPIYSNISEKDEITELKEVPIIDEKLRILCIDDDDSIRNLVENILGEKYFIITAKNATKGLEIINTIDTPFNILITDLIMPKMNGVILSKKVKQYIPNIKVIYITGYIQDIQRLIRISTNELILPKPFTPMELLNMIETLYSK